MEVQIDTKLDAGLYLWTWGNGYRSSIYRATDRYDKYWNIGRLRAHFIKYYFGVPKVD